MTLEAGTNIGPYRVMEQIGRGGMATVYKAHQASLARYVAIKVLPSFFAEDEGFRERFQQEAIAIARLRHPNILQVMDYGQHEGTSYIVTEFVDGGTLADQVGTQLPVDYVVKVLTPIASALDYAHARDILHRDVKPSNVLMARDGTPMLSDFGLAKMVGSMPRLTVSGATVGTPEYMAPEQGAGETLGPAADQYALAVVAYELLTGRVPFSAETPLAVLIAHMHKPLPLPRSVNPALPEAVELALLKGLAKDPGDRYPSAGAMMHAIGEAARTGIAPAAALVAAPTAAPAAAAAATAAPSSTALPTVMPSEPRSKGMPVPLVAAGGGLALLVLVGIAVLASARPGAPPAGTSPAPAAVATTPAPAATTPGAAATSSPAGTPAGPAAAGSRKGKLVWQAKLDNASEYQVNTFPDAQSAAVRAVPGGLELAILKPQGNASVRWNEIPPETYVYELDLEVRGNGTMASFDLRMSQRGGGHRLRITAGTERISIEELVCSGNTCQTDSIGSSHRVEGMRTGKRFTVTVVLAAGGFGLFVDGEAVGQVQVRPVGETAIGAQVFGLNEGSIRIYGMRIYELLPA